MLYLHSRVGDVVKKQVFLSLVLIIMSIILPFNVKASKSDIYAISLREAAKEENIEFEHPDYVDSSDKVNIYLFRGATCTHCYDLLSFLESIIDDYGDKFNAITFEVWNNKDNNKLMQKVADLYGDDVTGVPYLVIGEYTFTGYDESFNEAIIAAIDSLYNSEDPYDIMAYLTDKGYFEEHTTSIASLIVMELLTISVMGIIMVNTYRKQQTKIDNLTEQLNKMKK